MSSNRQKLREIFLAQESLSKWINLALIAAMMGCVMATVRQVGERLVPGMRLGYLPYLGFLVALEAIFSQNRIRRASDLNTSVSTYRFIEWVVILIVTKITDYLWLGVERFWKDIPFLAEDFMITFLNPSYATALLGLVFVWIMTTWYASDLNEITGDVALLEVSDGYVSNRAAIRQSFSSRFLTVGVLMIAATAVINIDLRLAMVGKFQVQRVGGLNIIVYFLLGMLLLSQTHFAILRASWAWERIPIDRSMAGRWIAYSLLTLFMISLLAYLLPTHYTLGFLTTLSFVLSILMTILYSAAFMILAPLIFLLGLITRLFSSRSSPIKPLPPPVLPEPPQVLAEAGPNPYLKLIQSILFWGLFIGVIGYAFFLYLKQNREMLSKLKQSRLARFLFQAFTWLAHRVHILNQNVAALVSTGVQRILALVRRPEVADWHYINVRKLSARQRVLFYFLAVVRRGGETGLPRKPDQTPYEYAHVLRANLPEITDSLEPLTESFVEARYSQHVTTQETANRVRQYWEFIRRKLQEHRQAGRRG